MKQVKCACCDHYFIPLPNNREKQKYCNAPACQKARNRVKNQIYRKKKGKDLTFKLSEARRQQRIRARRKELAMEAEARQPVLPAAKPLMHPPEQNHVSQNELAEHHQDALLGLTAMITGSGSPSEIRSRLTYFIETGKRLRVESWSEGCVTENRT